MASIITEYVNPQRDATAVEPRWWVQDPDDFYKYIFGIVRKIAIYQQFRVDRYKRYASMYGNELLMGLMPYEYTQVARPHLPNERLTLNAVASNVDTACAKISKAKTRPQFLTFRGDTNRQKRALLLTQYCDGVFYREKVYEKAQMAFLYGAVFGTGFRYWYPDFANGQIKCEYVSPVEITVDDAEAIYGEPRSLHRTKYIMREVLAEMFPKKEEEIYSCPTYLPGSQTTAINQDLLDVKESWHLPSGRESNDGVHCITIQNATLFHEEYKFPHFPFVKTVWKNALFGYHGIGIPQELYGLQVELNRTLRNIQVGINLTCVPRVFLEMSSDVISSHINNQLGAIVKYKGTPPIFHSAQAFSPEIYQYLENLYQKTFMQTGISQLSAQSMKPAGLNSGVAIRESQDIESERFALVTQRYEAGFLQDADLIVKLTKLMYEKGTRPKVPITDKEFMRMVSWKDIDLDEDEYFMRAMPTNALGNTYAARLEKVVEMMQGGLVDRTAGMQLLELPDTDKVVDIQTAARKRAISQIEKILAGESTVVMPDPMLNLEEAKQLAIFHFNKASDDEVSTAKLDLLATYIANLQALIDQNTGQQGMGMAGQVPGQVPEASQGVVPPQGQPLGIPEASVPPPGVPLPS